MHLVTIFCHDSVRELERKRCLLSLCFCCFVLSEFYSVEVKIKKYAAGCFSHQENH